MRETKQMTELLKCYFEQGFSKVKIAGIRCITLGDYMRLEEVALN